MTSANGFSSFLRHFITTASLLTASTAVGCSLTNVPGDINETSVVPTASGGNTSASGQGGSGGNPAVGGSGAGGGGSQIPSKRHAMATVASGGVSYSDQYTVWWTLGESPGGNGNTLASASYSFVGGLIAVTQP